MVSRVSVVYSLDFIIDWLFRIEELEEEFTPYTTEIREIKGQTVIVLIHEN